MLLPRRQFIGLTASATVGLALQAESSSQGGPSPAGGSRYRLIRNATAVIRYGGKTLLLDPWLSDAGVMPPVNNAPNPRPNPLVGLPSPVDQIIAGIDATVLTHTHFDHWDPVARERLPKATPIFVQPPDRDRVAQAGFTDVRPIDTSLTWEGVTITRTGGHHGTGDVGVRMGAVSGYVLRHPGAPTIYIAGDTVWCSEVETAIRTHRPDVIVVNAGEAQFLEGGPIIMGVDDVVRVCEAAPRATVIAVHLEAVNHCVLTRDGLRAGLTRAGVKTTVHIPGDGDALTLGA